MTSQYDKEIDQCPKCEGIWLGKDNCEYIFWLYWSWRHENARG